MAEAIQINKKLYIVLSKARQSMAAEMNLEDGIEELIERIGSKESPVLVAVYGWPNSGKSYLMSKIKERLEKEGWDIGYTSGAPSEETFNLIKEYSSMPRKGAFMFHCGWEREFVKGILICSDQDPNVLASNILDRDLDLNIGIYNPRLYNKTRGEYDLVISNPDSKRKG